MNCQDVSLALDDRDIGALNATQRREFDAHVAGCRECAGDWEIHQRMLATQAPPMPVGLPAQARVLVGARARSGGARRVSSRLVLLGTLLVVGAAAATLVLQLAGGFAPQAVNAVPASVPVSAAVADAVPSDTAPPTDVDQAAAEARVTPLATDAVKPFTVLVLPLRNEATDASSRQAIASMYASFLSRLRAVPGLTLLDKDSESAPDAQPGYRVTIVGQGSGNELGASVEAEILKPDGTLRAGFFGGSMVDGGTGCAAFPAAREDPSVCAQPELAAADTVEVLRKMVFVPDPSLRRELQARLLDGSLDVRQRLRALDGLSGLGIAQYGMEGAGEAAALRDPAIVRGAIDLATVATDPLQRAKIWNMLRGSRKAELVLPLLTALSQDSGREVRLAALTTLAADFGKDPRVHAALEAAARQEPHPMVRVLAQRAVGGAAGEAAWKDYIATSLKDANHSPVERIEALFYELGQPVSRAFANGVRNPDAPERTSTNALRSLDHEAIQALAAALPAAAAESTYVNGAAAQVLGSLASIEDAAITDMLLASVVGSAQWPSRVSAMQALGKLASRRDDPRVQAALTKISTDDPSPALRQAAVAVLQVPAPKLPAPTDKPRLGVMLNPGEGGELFVAKLFPDSFAQRAGIQEGDVLLEINGAPVSATSNPVKVMDTLSRGMEMEVVVSRAGQKLSLRARL